MDVKWTSPHPSWNKYKCWDEYFKNIAPTLESIENVGNTILPPASNRFNAFQLGVDDIKVVLIGQDPYHTKGMAHGYSFSVLPHNPTPPSLARIFDEACRDLGEENFPRPRSGDLRAWHSRGVFLYNAALTVEMGKPLSHINLWSKFTYETLSRLSRSRDGIVWMLLGKQAQVYKALIENSGRSHLILCAGHPSPLNRSDPFYGSGVFSKSVEYLNVPKTWWRL
jgi:uracil-DNA glycosylase